MSNFLRDFEDVLYGIYTDNFIEPSKDCFDLSSKELSEREFRRFVEKKQNAEKIYEQDLLKTKTISKYRSHTSLTFTFKGKSIPSKEMYESILFAMGCKGHELIVHHFVDLREAYIAFKSEIENGFYLPKEVQKKIGVGIDYSPIKEWDRRHIKWQAAAQVLWYYYPKYNLKEIQNEIKSFDKRLINYLEIDCLTSIMNKGDSRGRGLSDIVKLVAPSGSVKRGRPSKDTNKDCTTHLVLISKVYNPATQQVNFKALKIAIEAIVKTLLHQKVPHSEILLHPILVQYKKVAGLCEIVVDWWIQEAFQNE